MQIAMTAGVFYKCYLVGNIEAMLLDDIPNPASNAWFAASWPAGLAVWLCIFDIDTV